MSGNRSKLILLGVGAFAGVTAVRAAFFKEKKQPSKGLPAEKVDVKKFETDLSDAIKIPSIANSDKDLTDWSNFDKLHELLKERFPLMFEKLELTYFSRAAMMFHWQGKDPSLEPMALLGHQDVVPISEGTLGDWEHPPFDGCNDGEYIWGRGALDMKNHLIGVCEAVESLLEEGFVPERDVYICFGHNEEIMTGAADEGACVMAAWFKEKGIHLDSIIDEGGAILPVDIKHILNCDIAGIGIAEKGYADIEISVYGKGGHSSQPPKHTALGEMADVIKDIEGHQFPAKMTPMVYDLFTSIGKNMTYPGRLVVCNLGLMKPLVTRIMTLIPPAASLVRTTTGVTMASGSPASNVLPQKATINVNFRIMPGMTVADVEKHLHKVIRNKKVEIKVLTEKAKEPSKISPTDSEAFKVLASICKDMNPKAVIAPYLVMGGTDACRYEAVCDNIYRYSPFLVSTSLLLTTHGTNERIPVSSLSDGVAFFKRYIREVSASKRDQLS